MYNTAQAQLNKQVQATISHVSVKRECVRAHVSNDALPTREYLQTNSWVLANELTSIQQDNKNRVIRTATKRTGSSVKSLAWVIIFVGVSLSCINKLW